MVLSSQGKPDEAIAEFREAIRLNPDDPAAHMNLGNALYGQGSLAEAIAELRAAIRLKLDDARAHNNLAWALVLPPQGPPSDREEGLRHARRASQIDKNRGLILGTLALAEYRSGHWSESLPGSMAAG